MFFPKFTETKLSKQVSLDNESNLSFGDKNDEKDESSKYSDELGDSINDKRLFSNIPLKKIKTTIPDNIKMNYNFHDEIDDLLDNPSMMPLPKANAFAKHKSEMVKPADDFRSFDKSKLLEKEKNAKAEPEVPKKAAVSNYFLLLLMLNRFHKNERQQCLVLEFLHTK